MMMMTMKKRPIGKSSQTSTGAAFISWCFKSGNGSLGIVQYHRALSAPRPDKEQVGRYTLTLEWETNLSNIQRAIYNLEKSIYYVPSYNSKTFSCEEDLHRDEKEMSTR